MSSRAADVFTTAQQILAAERSYQPRDKQPRVTERPSPFPKPSTAAATAIPNNSDVASLDWASVDWSQEERKARYQKMGSLHMPVHARPAPPGTAPLPQDQETNHSGANTFQRPTQVQPQFARSTPARRRPAASAGSWQPMSRQQLRSSLQAATFSRRQHSFLGQAQRGAVAAPLAVGAMPEDSQRAAVPAAQGQMGSAAFLADRPSIATRLGIVLAHRSPTASDRVSDAAITKAHQAARLRQAAAASTEDSWPGDSLDAPPTGVMSFARAQGHLRPPAHVRPGLPGELRSSISGAWHSDTIAPANHTSKRRAPEGHNSEASSKHQCNSVVRLAYGGDGSDIGGNGGCAERWRRACLALALEVSQAAAMDVETDAEEEEGRADAGESSTLRGGGRTAPPVTPPADEARGTDIEVYAEPVPSDASDVAATPRPQPALPPTASPGLAPAVAPLLPTVSSAPSSPGASPIRPSRFQIRRAVETQPVAGEDSPSASPPVSASRGAAQPGSPIGYGPAVQARPSARHRPATDSHESAGAVASSGRSAAKGSPHAPASGDPLAASVPLPAGNRCAGRAGGMLAPPEGATTRLAKPQLRDDLLRPPHHILVRELCGLEDLPKPPARSEDREGGQACGLAGAAQEGTSRLGPAHLSEARTAGTAEADAAPAAKAMEEPVATVVSLHIEAEVATSMATDPHMARVAQVLRLGMAQQARHRLAHAAIVLVQAKAQAAAAAQAAAQAASAASAAEQVAIAAEASAQAAMEAEAEAAAAVAVAEAPQTAVEASRQRLLLPEVAQQPRQLPEASHTGLRLPEMAESELPMTETELPVAPPAGAGLAESALLATEAQLPPAHSAVTPPPRHLAAPMELPSLPRGVAEHLQPEPVELRVSEPTVASDPPAEVEAPVRRLAETEAQAIWSTKSTGSKPNRALEEEQDGARDRPNGAPLPSDGGLLPPAAPAASALCTAFGSPSSTESRVDSAAGERVDETASRPFVDTAVDAGESTAEEASSLSDSEALTVTGRVAEGAEGHKAGLDAAECTGIGGDVMGDHDGSSSRDGAPSSMVEGHSEPHAPPVAAWAPTPSSGSSARKIAEDTRLQSEAEALTATPRSPPDGAPPRSVPALASPAHLHAEHTRAFTTPVTLIEARQAAPPIQSPDHSPPPHAHAVSHIDALARESPQPSSPPSADMSANRSASPQPRARSSPAAAAEAATGHAYDPVPSGGLLLRLEPQSLGCPDTCTEPHMHLPRRIALPAPEPVAGAQAAELCVVLGRFGADVRLDSIRHPAMVSRKHCRLTRAADGAWWVEDLNTKNGTSLNGRNVRRRTGSAGRARLADGDELCLGTITGPKVTEVAYRLSL